MTKPWQAYLDVPDDSITLPWIRGTVIHSWDRQWVCQGPLPPEPGWYRWRHSGGRKTRLLGREVVEPDTSILHEVVRGPVVGDTIIPDSSREPERVYLMEEGLEPFSRISAGRAWPQGPLIYLSIEMPIGVEDAVLMAYEDRLPDLAHLKDVTPALRAAFRLETQRRDAIEAAREELRRQREAAQEEARRRREAEEARVAAEARRAEMHERGALSTHWRELAQSGDFEAAARGALEYGGGEYLSSRALRRGERVVRYKINDERIECVCDERTLQVIDSGICLTDERTGDKYDQLLTLESLPSVVREAMRLRRLVIFRRG